MAYAAIVKTEKGRITLTRREILDAFAQLVNRELALNPNVGEVAVCERLSAEALCKPAA